MATIKKLKTQVENANALGVANLNKKGVEISKGATTFEIMQCIAEIVGSGFQYTNIIYNDDNTIILTDKDGTEHTMTCTYYDDKLISLTYDGKKVELTYAGDDLVRVNDTNIDFLNAPFKDPVVISFSTNQAEVVSTLNIEPDITTDIRKEE